VHLLDELVVGQGREVEVLVRVRHASLHITPVTASLPPSAELVCSTLRNGAV
jgi:hypothetical protein